MKLAEEILKCWKGYERVPNTKAGEKGSCRKIEEAVDYKAIADQLVNNEEVSSEDLVELGGIKPNQADKIIKSWFDMDAKERNKLSFNISKVIDWIKKVIK